MNKKENIQISDKQTVLFVDDEEQILNSIRRGLHDEPYDKIFAVNGKEAIEILEKNRFR